MLVHNVVSNFSFPLDMIFENAPVQNFQSRLAEHFYKSKVFQVNINECDSNPCENGATCRDDTDGFMCQCAPGYYGSRCQHMLDHCSSSPCRNSATCINQVLTNWCFGYSLKPTIITPKSKWKNPVWIRSPNKRLRKTEIWTKIVNHNDLAVVTWSSEYSIWFWTLEWPNMDRMLQKKSNLREPRIDACANWASKGRTVNTISTSARRWRCVERALRPARFVEKLQRILPNFCAQILYYLLWPSKLPVKKCLRTWSTTSNVCADRVSPASTAILKWMNVPATPVSITAPASMALPNSAAGQ